MSAPPQDGPLTFTEEVLLLLLDNKQGAAASISRTKLDCALAAAVLMDLALAGRIGADLETMFVVDRTPTGNSLLDPVLARIATREETADTLAWLRELAAEDAGRIHGQAQVLLVRRGVLERRDGSFVWSFARQPNVPARWWWRIAGRPGTGGHRRTERRTGQRVREALLSDAIPDMRDAALIGLLETCSLLGTVVPDGILDSLGPRIAQLRRFAQNARGLACVVADIERSVARTLAETSPVRRPDCTGREQTLRGCPDGYGVAND